MTLLGKIARAETSLGIAEIEEVSNPATIMELVHILESGLQEEA